MSRPTDRTRPAPGASVEGAIRIFMDRVGELEEIISGQSKRLADVEDRLALVEARDRSRGTGQRTLDDVTVAMIAFMEEHYPMKFTALTLAENLGSNFDNEKLGSRLQTLLTRGLVVAHRRENKTTMWSALPPDLRPGNGGESGDDD